MAKKKKCADCPKLIWAESIRCKSCAGKAESQRRSEVMRRLHTDPAFKEKHRCAMAAKRRLPNHCCDCGAEIGPQAMRCSSCAAKHRWVKSPERMLGGVQSPERCRKIAKAASKNWANGVYDGIPPKLENHPNWQGGISFEPYGPDFNDDLKLKIRARDNFRCVLCDEPENGQAHDCHHINYDKHDNKENNLITLCMSCHSKTNFNRDYWQSYFTGEGYELMLGAC